MEDLVDDLNAVLTEESDKLDNMEKFMGTERYDRQETAVDALNDAEDYLSDDLVGDAVDALKSCKDYLKDAIKELEEWDENLTSILESSIESMKEAVDA